MTKKFKIGIVGNPNSGKTTLFNCLTGGRQKVGNWPGVTVERITGQYQYEDKTVEIIDLPGIYSLSTLSLDEQIARDFILKERPDLIINIVDASSLERNLYLTSQLLEMKIPLMVVLNKIDHNWQRKVKVDQVGLAKLLDCPVIGTVANRREGITGLFDFIDELLDKAETSSTVIHYPDEVERAIKGIQLDLKAAEVDHIFNERWLALKLLEGDMRLQKISANHNLLHKITLAKEEIKNIFSEDADIIIADNRYGFIHSISKKVVDRKNVVRKNVTDAIDRVILSPSFGLPIFLIT